MESSVLVIGIDLEVDDVNTCMIKRISIESNSNLSIVRTECFNDLNAIASVGPWIRSIDYKYIYAIASNSNSIAPAVAIDAVY